MKKDFIKQTKRDLAKQNKQNLKEKCRLVTGRGMWHLGDLHLSDGPHGLRAQDDGAKNNDSYEATCFPAACSGACSWNRDIVGEMAGGIAREGKELGVGVVLGPGVNIKRSPMCGRNFEYYSEDPYLAGELATSYVREMQKEGVGTSLKHFAGNSQETHRMTSNSMIDDRALHEIYLRAFEKVVKEARPATVMACYNYLNGVSGCENSYLLQDLLRKEWGYEGLVVSDWGACVNLSDSIRAGMDAEMPDSCGNHFDDLLQAAESDPTMEEALDTAVGRIAKLIETYGPEGSDGPATNGTKSVTSTAGATKCISKDVRDQNHILARRVAEESIVLLKNDGFFPLRIHRSVSLKDADRANNVDCAKDADLGLEDSFRNTASEWVKYDNSREDLLLIGDLGEHPRIQGGGSSHIHTERIENFKEEFEKRDVRVRFVRGYVGSELKGNARLEEEAVAAAQKAGERGIPVLFVGGLTDQTEGEGYDRENFRMPENQQALLARILEVNENVGFLSMGGAPYDMELPSRCRGLMQLYLGGEAVASAAVSIILGEVNPSGKLAESIPFRETDVPSYGHFGLQGEQKNHPYDVEYRESIMVGYRYYDTYHVPVRYCFGHGLSYTEFAYSNLSVTAMEKGGQVSFDVENVGSVAGSEVAQVYVKNPGTAGTNWSTEGTTPETDRADPRTEGPDGTGDGSAFRPSRELRGFEKILLAPGEKKRVTVKLDNRAFSVYQNGAFHVIGGDYEIQVGASLDDIRLGETLKIEGMKLESPISGKRASFSGSGTRVPIPLSEEDFGKIYDYPKTDFSHLKPGMFTTKNSLVQMAPYSRLARTWIRIGKAALRLMYFPKPMEDPEVRMALSGILEGSIDCVCNQSGGLLKHSMIQKIVGSANHQRNNKEEQREERTVWESD